MAPAGVSACARVSRTVQIESAAMIRFAASHAEHAVKTQHAAVQVFVNAISRLVKVVAA